MAFNFSNKFWAWSSLISKSRKAWRNSLGQQSSHDNFFATSSVYSLIWRGFNLSAAWLVFSSFIWIFSWKIFSGCLELLCLLIPPLVLQVLPHLSTSHVNPLAVVLSFSCNINKQHYKYFILKQFYICGNHRDNQKIFIFNNTTIWNFQHND